IELAIAVVVEHRRQQDVVDDEELIVDPNADWILGFLQSEGAQDWDARSMRRLVQRIKIGNEAVAQVQERASRTLDRVAVGVRFMIVVTERRAERIECRRRKPARVES